MATASRSGGKILRPRRDARVATPYDRPPNPNQRSDPENPNWISKLLLSPTRVIASGAGKLISSVFGPESSSSSSSSSSGSDSDFDNEIDEFNNGVDDFNKEAGESQTARSLVKESQPTAVTNENKLLIEQLLLQETFSWEECERLTCIIKSRVVEVPVNLDREVGRPSEMYNRAANRDVEMTDLCNSALLEARKWLKEKKSVSTPQLDLDPTVSPHVNEGQMGLPVDVAKSYMKERPPWSSPCLHNETQRSASPIGIRLFKDDDTFSNSLSSSKLKKDAPIIGSWNISEEIRRVRSKATEQLLRTPSTKIDVSGSNPRSSATKFDWSGSVLEYKYSLNSSGPSNSKAAMGDKNQTLTNLIDAPSDVPEADTANELPYLGDGSGDTKTILPSDICGDDGGVHRDTNGSSQQHGDVIPDSRVNEGVCSMPKEGCGTGDASVPNGLLHSDSRLNAEERDIRTYEEEQTPPTSSIPTSRLEEKTHEPLNEALAEAPDMNENDDIATGSQNSSSMQHDEMSQDVSQQSTKQAATPTKRERKVTRFGRKVRGRGK